MKRFISVVAGIVVAALVVIAVGDFALRSLLKTSHSSINQVSSQQISSNVAQSQSAGNGTANTSTGGTGVPSNSGPANSALSSSTNASSTPQNGSSSPPTANPSVAQAGQTVTLTQSQQNAISSAVQQLLNQSVSEPKDCSAFVQYVYAQANVSLPRTVSGQAKVGERISQNQLQYGDIVFFDLSSTKNQVTFDGIYIGNGKFIAETTHGIKSLELNSTYWKKGFAYGRHI